MDTKNKEFYLSALIDFPDDAGENPYNYESFSRMLEKLADCKVKRLYWQWYGDARDGYYWDNKTPDPAYRNMEKTARDMPDFNRFAVDTAHKLGMDTVGIMRPLESGTSGIYSDFYPEVRQSGVVPCTGGYITNPNRFLAAHPQARIKRRIYDIDEEAEKKNICTIEIRKQNAAPTRIRKENIELYVSDNNANYRKYTGEFDFTITTARAKEDVIVCANSSQGRYGRRTLTHKGDVVTAIRLSGLNLKEPYVAVVCSCGMPYDDEDMDARFENTLMAAMHCYSDDGAKIPICVGNKANVWEDPEHRDWRECGLYFDHGFGEYFAFRFDPENKEGVYAVCRGKSRYTHAAMCECDPAVQDYWFEMLNRCIDDGFDMISHRTENHSLMMDEPFAYGYNDSIKERYWERYGKCDESRMDIAKIAKIRGDMFSELFIEGAKRVRASGRKVAVQLNSEMLRNPLPLERRFAYPMNVEWQWERWLDEIQPDEITFRTFKMSPEFVLRDPQCLNLLQKAQATGAPITYERYCVLGDFAKEYKMIRDSGLFSSITLYEVASVIKSDGNGGIIEKEPELLSALKNI